jgi:heavy metal sensor kinase
VTSGLAAIPIRLRLALGFALVMTIVLAAVGAFVYGRTGSDLDKQISRELDARMAGVVAIVRDDGDDLGDPEQDPLSRVDAEGLVQVLGPGRRVADATDDAYLTTPLLGAEETKRLLEGEVDAYDIEAPGGPMRVIAAHSQDDGVPYTILVAASIAERNEALSNLLTLLLIGGPAALLASTLAAYWVAAAALRPVDAMRRRAAAISSEEPGKRLPVPAADDEIAELGRTLNEMLTRLEGAIERERRFVADASHELRTPLAILKAEVELALAEGRSADELRSALRSSGEEVDRLAELADDLLILARADEGRLPLQPQRVAVRELVERVGRGFESRLDGRRIAYAIPDRLVVEADPLRIEQALTNLIDNAARYGDGTIAVEAAAEGDFVELTVRDEGEGFPEELLGHATERFARASGGGGGGGAGLGLAIAESIATAHGGSLEAANDGGARVTIVLPKAARNRVAAS